MDTRWNLTRRGRDRVSSLEESKSKKSIEDIRSNNMKFITVKDLTWQGEKKHSDQHIQARQEMEEEVSWIRRSGGEIIRGSQKGLRGGRSYAGSEDDPMECSGGLDNDPMECSEGSEAGSDNDPMECSEGSRDEQPRDGAYDYFDKIFKYTPDPGEIQEIYRAKLTGGACVISAVQMVLHHRDEEFKDMDVAQALGYSWADGGAHIENIPFGLQRLNVHGAVYEVADNIEKLQCVLNKYGRPVIVEIGKPGCDNHVVIVNKIEDSYGDATFVCVCDSNSDIGHYKVSIDEWMSAWDRKYVYFT